MNEATINIDEEILNAMREFVTNSYNAGLEGKPNPHKDLSVEMLLEEYEKECGEPAGESMTQLYGLLLFYSDEAWNRGHTRFEATA